MKELGMAMSEYFYEYAMIGTLDMAYPSNQATFGHLGEFSKTFPLDGAHDQAISLIGR